MTSLTMGTQLIILLVTLALSNVLFAGESVKNAHKYNGPGYTFSNADTTHHVIGDFFSAVKVDSRKYSTKVYKQGSYVQTN